MLYAERTILDKASGAPIATMTLGSHAARRWRLRRQARSAAGAASAARGRPARHVDIKTAANAALIYRLSGDRNPLHADPKAAAAGGFKTPILHGLCTYGVAGRALVRACCGGDPARLIGLQVRFSVTGVSRRDHPHGDVAEREPVSFRARVLERDVVVLNNGLAKLAG